jgi:hypothetical protein
MPTYEIERNAPYTTKMVWPIPDDVRNTATINIEVRALHRSELGLLNAEKHSAQDIEHYIGKAFEKKNNDDVKAYGKTTEQLYEEAAKSGYLNSPAHMAWSEAAAARTNGVMSAERFRRLDPYGGTAGNGPDILPQGAYPGVGAKIAMAHDTDWSLGRYFQAGPMRGLYGSKESAAEMGMYGLQNHCKVQPKLDDLYINGHNDWSVNFNQHPTRRSAIETGGAVMLASEKDAQSFRGLDTNPLYKQAMAGIEKLPADTFKNDEQRQNAAGSLAVEANNNNFKQIGAVALSANGTALFATSGAQNDPASDKVSVEKMQAVSQPVEKSAQLLQLDMQTLQVAQLSEQKKVQSM